MLFYDEKLDKNVVYVNIHGVAELVSEHLVDELLIGGTSILQPKGKDFVTKDASFSNEGSLLLVIWVHEDLVIAR